MTTATDPTLRTLARFADPSQWAHVEENVPIFVEHTSRACQPDGRMVDVTVDAARLRRVADKINERLRETGNAVKLTLGHTRPPDQVRQEDQPPIAAYGVGARVRRFGRGRRLAVVLDRVCFRKDLWDQAKHYPDRSPEFYAASDEITTVALLKTDPKLDLGQLVYARADGAICYGRGVDAMADPTMDPPGAPAPAPEHKPEAQTPPEGVDPRFHEQYMACVKHHAAAAPAAPHAYGAGTPALPSPTNAAVPGLDVQEKKKDEDEEEELPVRAGRLDLPTLYQRVETLGKAVAEVRTENKALRDTNADLALKYARSESQRAVRKLMVEDGILVKDPKGLVEKLTVMTAEARKGHVGEIRDNWQHDPTAANLPAVEVDDSPEHVARRGDPDEFTEVHLEKAAHYIRTHPGCPEGEALRYARGEITLDGPPAGKR